VTEWIVTSSVLILVVLGLRFALKGKLRLRLQYGLWALVLIRLLIPLSIASPLSIMNFMPQPQVLDRTVGYRDYQLPDLAMPEIDPSLSPEEQQVQLEQNKIAFEQEIEAAKKQTGTPVTVEKVLLYLWICGMVVTGLLLTAANAHFAAKLRRSRQRLEMKSCPLPVYVSSCVETPCLYGPLLPKIYLTPSLDGQHLDHVLIHELTHWRHGDHCWSLLRCMCLVLHWYNPLVWLAARVSRQDAELACDEAVIRQLGEEQRTAYGATLIRMSCIKRDATGLLIGATTMLTTKKSLKERITMIARKPKTALVTLICVLLIAAVAVGCTFTGAKQEPIKVAEGLSFQQDQLVYLRFNGGIWGSFRICIKRDGSFTYSEGQPSSYFGNGQWTLDENILTLHEKRFTNRFRVEEDALVWLSEGSTGFTYSGILNILDGERFLLQGEEAVKLTNVAELFYLPQDYMDGGPLGCFVCVDGVTYVWDHNVVDSFDGLPVKEVGTVASNDPSAIPNAHLSACRIPEGTVLYKGKDAGLSKYEAIYYRLEGHSQYARMLPMDAYRGEERWWEARTIHDGVTLTVDALRKLSEEHGKELNWGNLAQYSYVQFPSPTFCDHRLFQVDEDYRLMLVSPATQTISPAFQARFYHKDSPNAWVDILTTDIDTYWQGIAATFVYPPDNR